ncbi:Fpg/Nei family DNA glycosylase [Specibacter cremeus]|uniref:Fpg/Nei family DNA glycosylase n=1 Tax=Specibacter cremeus TaxID=1629051 RepID=UPI000F76C635|nr:DNA-formamidopyrimidine glycosylase family protein [Specibacter cremeus]
MPEGDTVWRQARDLHRALAGERLARSDFRVPSLAAVDLAGRVVEGVRAHGKHLLMDVSAGVVIHSHLGMDGIWHIYPTGDPAPRWRRPAHTARAVLRTERAVVVGFSLATLEVVPATRLDDVVGRLGPDLLGPDWYPAEALRRLRQDPARPIGLALLDQRNLAGIGNIYRSELCFLGGVHPATPVGAVPDLVRMVELAKRLLEANKDRAVRSTTGGPSRGDGALWVYRLAGRPCKRCGSIIRHATLGDPAVPARPARDIYYCPRCQPVS